MRYEINSIEEAEIRLKELLLMQDMEDEELHAMNTDWLEVSEELEELQKWIVKNNIQ